MADLETAIDVCRGAIRNSARITGIIATDDAESERSVIFDFSADESLSILEAAFAALRGRSPSD